MVFNNFKLFSNFLGENQSTTSQHPSSNQNEEDPHRQKEKYKHTDRSNIYLSIYLDIAI